MNEEFDDGRVTFYYSRDERLKKAPQSVRDLNSAAPLKKQGLFRTLTATRPLAFMFVSMVTLCVAVVMLSLFLNNEGVRVLGKNTVTVSAINVGDKSYITVKKTIPNGVIDGVYSGAVNVAVSLPDDGSSGENPIHAERIYFTPEQEELFRFSVPFNGKKILILMEAGTEQIVYSIAPE